MATDTISSEMLLIRAEDENSKNIVLSHTDNHQCVFCPENIFSCLHFILLQEGQYPKTTSAL